MNSVAFPADPIVPRYRRIAWPDWGGEFGGWVDTVLVEEGQRFLDETPGATLLGDDSPLHEAYYLRHRIETVWRIWLTARTDAIALTRMIDEDYESARSWAEYTAQELDHDRMFLSDLLAHGVTREQVVATGPFPATRAMVEDIEQAMAEWGSLPAVTYSLFVEWNSERFSARAVEKAEAAFSERHVAGSKSHVGVDLEESHLPMMLGIAGRLVERIGSRDPLEALLRRTAAHFRAYFEALHRATAAR